MGGRQHFEILDSYFFVRPMFSVRQVQVHHQDFESLFGDNQDS